MFHGGASAVSRAHPAPRRRQVLLDGRRVRHLDSCPAAPWMSDGRGWMAFDKALGLGTPRQKVAARQQAHGSIRELHGHAVRRGYDRITLTAGFNPTVSAG